MGFLFGLGAVLIVILCFYTAYAGGKVAIGICLVAYLIYFTLANSVWLEKYVRARKYAKQRTPQLAAEARAKDKDEQLLLKQQAALALEWEQAASLPDEKAVEQILTEQFPDASIVIRHDLVNGIRHLKIDKTIMRPAEAHALMQKYIGAANDAMRTYREITAPKEIPAGTFPYRYYYSDVEQAALLGQVRDEFRKTFADWKPGPYLPASLSLAADYDTEDGYDWKRYERDRKIRDKQVDEIYKNLTNAQGALLRTPLFDAANIIAPTFDLRPLAIPEETYFKSTFIVAPPGRGKTTLLRHLFYDRLELVKQNKASIIILDSKGQFADEVSHLKLFAKGQPLHDKLILINPDADYPLALNPLQLDPIPANATEGQRGLAQSRTIELIEYLVSVFVPGEPSNPQQRFLRAVIKALLEVFPNPTFEDLYDLLVNGYEKHEDKMSRMKDRSFFSKEQFHGSTVKPTRESLITRIGFMRDNYALASIIKSRESRLNLADAMDSGKVVIINNGIDLLGDEGCEFFGRFFLYLMRKAAERRRPIPEHKKMPVYVMCDEAHNVIKRDDKIARTIQDLRSHKIAMTFAIQDLSEIHSDKVKSALFSCGIIMANTKEDAPALVSRLRVKDEDPLSFINRPTGQFASYVFGTANDAVAINVPNPPRLPAMEEHEFAEVTQLMHERYCVRPTSEPEPPPDPAVKVGAPPKKKQRPHKKDRAVPKHDPMDFG